MSIVRETATAPAAPHAETAVIRVRGVSKVFHIQKQQPFLVRTLFRRLLGLRRHGESLTAVDGVTFDVRAGETVAFMGRNGAGKSTLLSMLVGTILPTSGTVSVQGRIGALLALGVGFHPLLTGRENVYLNASLHGLSNREIDAKYDSIVDFAEIADFMGAPLATYSSGMVLRLGFAVAVHLDPEIVIVDEALAVGDQGFREKCKDRVMEMVSGGKTLLFVSHSEEDVRRLCSRVIWLDHGRLILDGTPEEVLPRYGEFITTGTLPAPKP